VSGSGGGSAEVKVTKIVPDDRSKALVIVASERAYLRMLEVIKRIDVPPTTGDGDIHVLALQHAMAEELAPVLNQILGGAGGSVPGAPGQPPRPPTTPGSPGVSGVGGVGQLPLGILEGAVRITADKSTNSVIVTSSLRDYAQVRNVIDQLDKPRRQVFIEAVVMDVSASDSDKLSLSYHGGAAPSNVAGQEGNSLIYGGLNPLSTIGFPNPNDLNGLALGVRGPGLEGSTNLLGTGITVPAFGVLLNALATNSNANVLATPHIIATDNIKAEISVGRNIPLQTNAAGLGNLAGLAGGQAGGALAGLGGLGGLGGFGAAPRTDVGTKISVTPHMNDSNEVRLELVEEISEQGDSPTGSLGAVSINKRTANTSVVVKDQQTVVIGGLVRDAYSTAVQKIPLLGDIPVLGVLFRRTENKTEKQNLLLILTPYVIRDQQDLRVVFERKMQERQEFLDRYFVFSDQRPYEVPKDFTRLNGLLEDIRQANLSNDERRRLTDAAKPRDRKVHEPTTPIEMPDIVRPSGGAGSTVQAPNEGGGGGRGRRGGDTTTAGGQANAPGRTGPAVLNPGNRGAPSPRRE
jgi:general secretion pathway protein D